MLVHVQEGLFESFGAQFGIFLIGDFDAHQHKGVGLQLDLAFHVLIVVFGISGVLDHSIFAAAIGQIIQALELVGIKGLFVGLGQVAILVLQIEHAAVHLDIVKDDMIQTLAVHTLQQFVDALGDLLQREALIVDLILEEIAVHDLHGQLQVAQIILVAVALPLGSEGIGAFLVVVVVGALPILEQTVDSLLAVIVADTEGLALAVVQFHRNILGQIQIFFLNAQQNSQGVDLVGVRLGEAGLADGNRQHGQFHAFGSLLDFGNILAGVADLFGIEIFTLNFFPFVGGFHHALVIGHGDLDLFLQPVQRILFRDVNGQGDAVLCFNLGDHSIAVHGNGHFAGVGLAAISSGDGDGSLTGLLAFQGALSTVGSDGNHAAVTGFPGDILVGGATGLDLSGHLLGLANLHGGGGLVQFHAGDSHGSGSGLRCKCTHGHDHSQCQEQCQCLLSE